MVSSTEPQNVSPRAFPFHEIDMTGEKWVTLVTDGGFGRRLGEYEGRTVLMGVKTDETEG